MAQEPISMMERGLASAQKFGEDTYNAMPAPDAKMRLAKWQQAVINGRIDPVTASVHARMGQDPDQVLGSAAPQAQPQRDQSPYQPSGGLTGGREASSMGLAGGPQPASQGDSFRPQGLAAPAPAPQAVRPQPVPVPAPQRPQLDLGASMSNRDFADTQPALREMSSQMARPPTGMTYEQRLALMLAQQDERMKQIEAQIAGANQRNENTVRGAQERVDTKEAGAALRTDKKIAAGDKNNRRNNSTKAAVAGQRLDFDKGKQDEKEFDKDREHALKTSESDVKAQEHVIKLLQQDIDTKRRQQTETRRAYAYPSSQTLKDEDARLSKEIAELEKRLKPLQDAAAKRAGSPSATGAAPTDSQSERLRKALDANQRP